MKRGDKGGEGSAVAAIGERLPANEGLPFGSARKRRFEQSIVAIGIS
jgi:hypothetical protein